MSLTYLNRWGDPEAQGLVPSIKNDFIELSHSVWNEEINSLKLKIDHKKRVVIAGSAKGYLQNYSQVRGKEIWGLENAMRFPGVHIFGAGIKKLENRWVVDGGRVFYIVGEANSTEEARKKAYQAIKEIEIDGSNLHYRTDIGLKQII